MGGQVEQIKLGNVSTLRDTFAEHAISLNETQSAHFKVRKSVGRMEARLQTRCEKFKIVHCTPSLSSNRYQMNDNLSTPHIFWQKL